MTKKASNAMDSRYEKTGIEFCVWRASRILLRAGLLTATVLCLSSHSHLLHADASHQNKTIPKKVFISQIVDHPALEATYRGIEAGLREEGFKAGADFTLHRESAQNNASLASQIASKFAAQKADCVVAIGTVAAQSLVPYANKGQLSLVYSSITDPIKAGLLDNPERASKMRSGVSNFVALAPQLELFKEILPGMTPSSRCSLSLAVLRLNW